ncbi:MAG: ABC transporter ATP-binding protein [Pseudomonadota bacterium]
MTAALLATEGLVAGYGGATVLRGVSLALAPGEVLAVLGKNGMGKSTLLKAIMGFLPVRGGRVRMEGQDVTGLQPHRLARTGIAYSPQEFTIFQDLTVGDNLRLGAPTDRIFAERLESLRGIFPRMLERLKQRAGTLSGGEQKMLLMSRALLSRPRIMLVDEISEGLQPTMIDRMAEALAAARRDQGVSVLLVEQNLGFAVSVADRYAVLKLGEVVEEGAVGAAADTAVLAEHLKV